MASDLPRCTEQTVVLTIALPEGQRWAWLGDCNVLALSPHLNATERQEALIEVGATWRRSFLRVVDTDAEIPDDIAALQGSAVS